MRAYAARAVPWGRVVTAAVLVVVLMDLVRRDPWVLWPLQGTAVGLLAGASAWCFDEPAAAVVDPAPRGPAWRAAVRAPAVALLVAAWAVGVLRGGEDAAFGHPGAVLVQGLAAVAVGAAAACWQRGRGAATPGVRFATAVVPAVTAWSLVRPFHEHLTVFPYGDTASAVWRSTTAGWLAVGFLACALLGAALAEAPWWHLGHGRAGRPGRAGQASSVAGPSGSTPATRLRRSHSR